MNVLDGGDMSTPNPGSDAAIRRGCICPRLDNNRGRFAPRPPDGWFVVEGCRVHAPDGFDRALVGAPA